MSIKKKIILFGASSFGEEVYKIFKHIKIYDVVAFADNDIEKQKGTFCGIPVISAEEAVSKNHYIIITSTYVKEISNQLVNLGCNNFQENIKYIIENIDQATMNSANYWENRYQNGGTSGSGSYGRLAQFKAEVINTFVKKHNINSVIELGCGDGNQLSLMEYPRYLGFDVSETAVRMCMQKFKGDETRDFILYNTELFECKTGIMKADLTISLDVIYHLLEDCVYEKYMHILFSLSQKYVVIYSSDYDEITSLHERRRKFTNWVNKNHQDYKLIDCVTNKYPSPRDGTNSGDVSESDFYFYEKF